MAVGIGKEASKLAEPATIALGSIAVVLLTVGLFYLRHHAAQLEARAEAALPGPIRRVRVRHEGEASDRTEKDAADLAVRCRDVVKTYGKAPNQVAALRGLDLDVRRGELTMIVGPSSCGKTSLISVIATLLEPDGGTCDVLGEEISRLDPAARARFRNEALGFVFQVFNLLPALTVVENISVPLLIAGVSRRDAEARAAELAEEVGLRERLDARPRELSGGQQQRARPSRERLPAIRGCSSATSRPAVSTTKAANRSCGFLPGWPRRPTVP